MVCIFVPRLNQPVYIKPRDTSPMTVAMTVSDIHHRFATGFEKKIMFTYSGFFNYSYTIRLWIFNRHLVPVLPDLVQVQVFYFSKDT